MKLQDHVNGNVAFVSADRIAALIQKWRPDMSAQTAQVVAALQAQVDEGDWWQVDDHAATLGIEVTRV